MSIIPNQEWAQFLLNRPSIGRQDHSPKPPPQRQSQPQEEQGPHKGWGLDPPHRPGESWRMQVSAVWKIEQNRWVGMDVKGWVEPLIIVHHHLYIFNHIYTWYYMVHLPSYPRLRCTSLRSSGSTWGAMDRKRQFPPAPQRWNLAVVEALTKWKSEVQICSQHVEMTVHVLHFHIAVYIQSACCCTCSLRVCVRAQLTASSLWPLSCGYHPCRSRMLFKISWPSSRDSRDHLPRNHIQKLTPLAMLVLMYILIYIYNILYIYILYI